MYTQLFDPGTCHVGLPEKIDGTPINLMVILSATFKSERWQIIATDP